MTLSSMTGFAASAGQAGAARWAWEVRSVNSRGLDIKLRLPSGLEAVEIQARALAQSAFTRGSLSATLTIRRDAPAVELRLNEPLLDQIYAATRAVAARHGVPPPALEALLSIRGVLETVEAENAGVDDTLAREALAGFAQALEELRTARREEGARLGVVLAHQIGEIERLGLAAREAQGARAVRIEERLGAQVAALLDASSMFDPVRLHQEAVLLATKADVQEEIDRLLMHVTAARALLAASEPVGRRLDFLSQEFNREANTLCAKSGDSELTAIGLELKSVIEQFREQVQNVE